MHRFALLAAVGAAFLAMPAHAEKLTQEQLSAYMAVAPAAPAGWKRAERSGNYSSASASTFSVSYDSEDGTKRFMFIITFSKDNTEQTRELLTDADQRNRWGFTLDKIKGRDAVARKPEDKNKSKSVFLVPVSENRSVSVMELSGDIDRAVLKAFMETVDFEAVAKK